MKNILEIISKSKIRQKIILLFNYNPGREFYIGEVAKIVKTSSGTAQRELEKLASVGFLKKQKKANLTYFKINEQNSLLNDIKNIIAKTIGLEYVLTKELSALKQINFAFLFGSYVKGDFQFDSDIDLYVVGDIDENELYKAVKKAETRIMRAVNYHMSSMEEFKENIKRSFFYKEILQNNLLLIGDKHEFRKFIK